MPRYRITTQESPVLINHGSRAPRSDDTVKPQAEVIEAATMSAAMFQWGSLTIGPKRRIVAIEELSQWSAQEITDDQITEALTRNNPSCDALDPDFFDDADAIYDRLDFTEICTDVTCALRESALVPGLNLSLISDGLGGTVDYAMVEIYDVATGQYRSLGSELHRLTTDRSATGWDGVIAIARALIDHSSELI